jgi:hypothetical protein
LVAVSAAAAGAQAAQDEKVAGDKPGVVIRERAVAPFEAGAVVTAPRRLAPTDPGDRPLSCQVVCSPFEPRQSIAQIAWPERAATAVDEQAVRFDIVGGVAKFEDGNYATVRLGAIPRVEVQPGVGIDVEAVRKQATPALLQRVENNRVVPRDPALPAPEVLKRERMPTQPAPPPAAKEAMERDQRTGAFGRMQAVAQSVEIKRTVPHRNVVLAGLQPGLTYKVRVVQERGTEADTIAEDICRVPVCPADFVKPQ